MEIFKRLGLDVKPIINAAGHVTMYCGATMPKEVVDAMAEVAYTPVRMDELQAAASKVIAEITGAEAGYVTCGCAAALTLGTAACMTGPILLVCLTKFLSQLLNVVDMTMLSALLAPR
jgi:D-glucosaminate-6-phosphate ammonia-lyase